MSKTIQHPAAQEETQQLLEVEKQEISTDIRQSPERSIEFQSGESALKELYERRHLINILHKNM